MKRESKHYTIPDAKKFLRNLLTFGSRLENFCLLNSNRSFYPAQDKYSQYDLLAGIGSIEEMESGKDSFYSLRTFHESNNDWLFGFFGYDLKNENSQLSSGNYNILEVPEIHFFRPRYVISLNGNECEIFFFDNNDNTKSVDELFSEIISTETGGEKFNLSNHIPEIKERASKDEYIGDIKKILAYIQRGDVYELNYCQEFYSENAVVNPAETYLMLNNFSPMPFSCFYRLGEKYLMCASPERFLKKESAKIISQPIKGTITRSNSKEEDILQKEKLLNDKKERAENVMIVDIVRNDLSRTAKTASVKVEELFGIYSFPLLHQMISTVTSEIRNDVHWTDVIRHAFPMGSMTGAPKIRAMQLIDQYEKTKRGLFSGSVGYVTPAGDFDFNVVIRSMIYDAEKKYLSFIAGSAITSNSIPEKEYEECLLKAAAFFEIFPDKLKLSTQLFAHV